MSKQADLALVIFQVRIPTHSDAPRAWFRDQTRRKWGDFERRRRLGARVGARCERTAARRAFFVPPHNTPPIPIATQHQVTYCLVQLACGTLMLVGGPGTLTDYLLLGSAGAGLALALLPSLAQALRLRRRAGAAFDADRPRPSAGGGAVSAALLSALFAVAAASLISDAGGSCAINGGRLPARRFGLDVVGSRWARPKMGAAPWTLCISVDLAIAAGARARARAGPFFAWGVG